MLALIVGTASILEECREIIFIKSNNFFKSWLQIFRKYVFF